MISGLNIKEITIILYHFLGKYFMKANHKDYLRD